MPDFYDFINYLNANGRDTTYSKIIVYLLTHGEEVQKLTISEIAERCYVSPATMTRFSKHFNLTSFQQLREFLSQLTAMRGSSALRMKEKELSFIKQEPLAYLASYGKEISDSIQDVIQSIDNKQVDQILQAIFEADQVVLIGYSATLELARDLQMSFLSNNKLCFVGETPARQKELLTPLTKKSVIITISSYGTLLNKSSSLIREISQSPAHSYLFTQHTKNTLTNLFDLSVNVTTESYVRIGTYPLTFFFDYFVRRYASLYNET